MTESYLGMDENIRECQNDESFFNCTTKYYINTILEQCRCLPMSIRLSKKVLMLNYEMIVREGLKSVEISTKEEGSYQVNTF